MKYVTIAAIAAVLACSPALAGGSSSKNVINVGATVSTGKGGLVGTLLGTDSHSAPTVIKADVKVATGKTGLLGALLGGGSSDYYH
jgi:hypothetical protein